MAETFDVVVIGGGPAGSTAARLLAQWGHSTLILNKPPAKHPALAESLPPTCRKLFGFLGILERLDAAGFYPARGNTVWWGDSRTRAENFDRPGYQVLRSDFDRLLLELAGVSGAHIRHGAAARDVDLSVPDQARIEYEPARGAKASVAARYVLDCSGRAGVVARKALRRKERYSTLAIAGVWKQDHDRQVPDAGHTLVETYRDGWAWSVPISSEMRCFAVMVNGHEAPRSRGLKDLYRADLDKTIHFKRILSEATLTSGPWSCDASLYFASRYAGPNFLLVGDAGSFIEPLSSFGVKKAIASAWVAAVAVHTCLKRPEIREAALDFFSAREQQVYASYLRQSARYFQEAAQYHPHPFWLARAQTGLDSHAWEPDEEELKRDPEVLAAFESLKQSPSINLRVSPGVRVEKKAVIDGREIALVDAVVSPGLPGGVRFLGNVNLPRLLKIAAGYNQVPDLFDAYNRLCPPVEIPNFLGALSVLLAKGILTNEGRRGKGDDLRVSVKSGFLGNDK